MSEHSAILIMVTQFLCPGLASCLASVPFRLLERPPAGGSRLLCGSECVQPSEYTSSRSPNVCSLLDELVMPHARLVVVRRDVAHEEMEKLYKGTTETALYILQKIQSGRVPGCDLEKPVGNSLIANFVTRVCIAFSIVRTVLDPISTDLGQKFLENFEAGRLSARLDDVATMPVREDRRRASVSHYGGFRYCCLARSSTTTPMLPG